MQRCSRDCRLAADAEPKQDYTAYKPARERRKRHLRVRRLGQHQRLHRDCRRRTDVDKDAAHHRGAYRRRVRAAEPEAHAGEPRTARARPTAARGYRQQCGHGVRRLLHTEGRRAGETSYHRLPDGQHTRRLRLRTARAHTRIAAARVRGEATTDRLQVGGLLRPAPVHKPQVTDFPPERVSLHAGGDRLAQERRAPVRLRQPAQPRGADRDGTGGNEAPRQDWRYGRHVEVYEARLQRAGLHVRGFGDYTCFQPRQDHRRRCRIGSRAEDYIQV